MAYTTINDPTAYFQTKLYTGNSSTQSITFDGNTNMQPDWVWIKSRSAAEWHQVHDSVRSVAKYLFTNENQAEGERSPNDQVTSFNSNGFSLGAGANDSVNSNGGSYASWNWKAGTSVSGNTGGSGTAKSYTGSVNTDAGFSIITYTGNGTAGHTIPHHLSAVPNIVLTKGRSAALNWFFFDSMSSYLKRLKLNTTDAQADTDGLNDTAPTSSVFTVSGGGEGNTNGATYVAYLFSEKQGFSKFGTYIGNGASSANSGTFVYTGFKPSFVIVKNTDTEGWQMWDNKRSSYNGQGSNISPNSGNAESTGVRVHFFSNGFQLVSSGADQNSSGATFIFMSFAEQPLVTSTGVPATAR